MRPCAGRHLRRAARQVRGGRRRDRDRRLTPYASILIPTHDRACTLAAAVQAALGQSVADVEVLIVGDGCTAAVRAVASACAAADGRVRFLDRPKAPRRGAANRHAGVLEARAARILYSDDDDLLLPHHVATLGPTLGDLALVDTPVVSVTATGDVAVGLLDSAHPLQRRLLREDRYKGVFDTHLAHRRDAYLHHADAWLAGDDHRVVLHMLRAMEAANLPWETRQRITALSFHGSPRVTMSDDARARELEAWSSRLAEPGLEDTLASRAGRCAHAFLLLHALALADVPCAGDPLTHLDLHAANAHERTPGAIPLSSTEHAALRALAAALRRERAPRSDAARALRQLLGPLLGPDFMARWVLDVFGACYDLDALRRMLDDAPPAAATWLGRVHLALGHGAVESGLAIADATVSQVPAHERFWFAVAVAEHCAAIGATQAAWTWTTRGLPLAPPSRHATGFWRLRAALAPTHGDARAEAEARERARTLVGRDV